MNMEREDPKDPKVAARAAISSARAEIQAAEVKLVEAIAHARSLTPPVMWKEIAEVLDRKEPNVIRTFQPLLTTTTKVTVNKRRLRLR